MNDVAIMDFEKLTIPQLRNFLKAFEDFAKNLPQLDVPLKHYFSHKVYGREIEIAKGSYIVGKIHKHMTMNVISKGEVSILSIDGAIRVKAPFTFISSPGAKRLIFTHEDSVWTTFHGTEETDISKIEDEFIAKTYDEVVEVKSCLG